MRRKTGQWTMGLMAAVLAAGIVVGGCAEKSMSGDKMMDKKDGSMMEKKDDKMMDKK